MAPITPNERTYDINKSFRRKIVLNYQSWEFSTSLTTTVIVHSAAELEEENRKLFEQAKLLTEKDIKRHSHEFPGE